MHPHILPATVADAPEILALQRLAYQAEARLYADWSIPPLTQTLAELKAELAAGLEAERQTESPRFAALKAVDDSGAIVGSVRAGLDAPPGEGAVCRIGRPIVHPKRQRQGLGSACWRPLRPAFPARRATPCSPGQKARATCACTGGGAIAR